MSHSRNTSILFGIYTLASLLHFAHNAEYIAFYPNMPRWLTRERVYLAWFSVAGVGVAGIACAATGWRVASALLFTFYGALGLYGLGHYALASCGKHTLAANATIWFEVISGAALAVASARSAVTQISEWRRAGD
jgi:hypothetical protein